MCYGETGKIGKLSGATSANYIKSIAKCRKCYEEGALARPVLGVDVSDDGSNHYLSPPSVGGHRE